MTRLRILAEHEIEMLYKIPKLNPESRQMFFSLTAEDVEYLDSLGQDYAAKINYVLQLGYFQATQYFFSINFFKLQADVKFIIQRYFPDSSYPRRNCKVRCHYANKNKIMQLHNVNTHTSDFLQKIIDDTKQLPKVDARAKSLFDELLSYCEKSNVIRPTYSVLQKIVARILKDENQRLIAALKLLLSRSTKYLLNGLLTIDGMFYKLTLLKKDPKDFSISEMRKEMIKQNYIAELFDQAKQLLPKLEISRQNIKYYGSLAEYYDIDKLKKMESGRRYLFLLCFVWQRFIKINDHLVSYFIYKTNYYVKEADQYGIDEIYRAKLAHDKSRVRAGKILQLISNDKVEDPMIRPQAFKIIPRTDFDAFTQNLVKPNFDAIAYHWKYYARRGHAIKTNLRAAFNLLDFSYEKRESLQKASNFLKNHFKCKKIFSNYPIATIPLEFMPKNLKRYIIKKEPIKDE